jgi:DNA-binding transcriptional ArsR family regulator
VPGTAHAGDGSRPGGSSWTLLSNHGHVIVALAREPDLRLRDVAEQVGLTERAVQQIVKDLESAGYLTVTRLGRRNHYEVNRDVPLRHPLHAPHTVGELLGRLIEDHP